MAREPLLLTIQRQVVAILVNQNLSQQIRPRAAFLNGLGRAFGHGNRFTATFTGIFQTLVFLDDKVDGNRLQLLPFLDANLAQVRPAMPARFLFIR